MPWTFFDSSGRKLNTASTLIDNLDIDGATDIGAAIVDADLFIIDDGAGGTNRKTAASRIATYIGSAVTREGGNTSEGTTTSTTVVDLLTSSSLTVLVTEPFYYTWNGRKTSGASAWFSHGIKLNSTTITDAATLGIFYSSGDADEVQDGGARVWFGPRVTNYFTNVNGQFSTFDASQVAHNVLVSKQNLAAVIPNATVTDVIVTAKVNNASITTGADEAQIYSEAAS